MRHALPAGFAILAFSIGASAQTPAGGEFGINTYTTGRQEIARAAMEPDGDFVAVWTSSPQYGASYGVFGQRFAASGAPRGSEFRINAYTTGAQFQPAVAVGSRGDFVVVWASEQGASVEIQGQRFDASGSAIGAEFRVNTVTTGYQREPHVGRAGGGGFVVCWESPDDGSSSGIAARRFDVSGSPIGSEFVVNTYTTGHQAFGDLAVEQSGNFVAVWEDVNNRDGSGYAIFGQRYDASGSRVGSEFQVNSYTTGNQRIPSVSVSPAGGFVVAWRSEFGDGSSYGVFSRRFDASGNALGNDFVVSTYTTGFQYGAFGQVAHDATGNFVVTWNSSGDGGGYGAFAQRFSASGARRGAEFRVNTYTTARQRGSSVASDSVGNFVVAWDSDGQDGSSLGVFAQRFGGLLPAALAVDMFAGPTSDGNGVFEAGETVTVAPSWRNVNGSPQVFFGTATNFAGPGAPNDPTYTVADAFADYGIVVDGATASCLGTNDCFALGVTVPTTRPVAHWDASLGEDILPDAQGQSKAWTLHIGESFTDVPRTSGFYRFIETLLHHGVTSGCSATEYCPATSTTREQMAVFVLVAKEGTGYVPPACTTPLFPDVPASNPFCRWIEELARRAVVGGCGGGNYCPASAVTREQMAVFVLRTLDPALAPPPCAVPLYNDVPVTSGFCPWIEELTRRGVVSGCGGGNYCPTASVTREQMGVFMGVTFGLTLYGP